MATESAQIPAGQGAAGNPVPAAPFPSSTYDRFTIAPGNVVVHKWLCDNTKTPARAIFILQHGFGEYAERYLTSHYQLIPKLVAEGFEVWALDFYGHGRSPGNRGMVNVAAAVHHHLEMRKRAVERGLPIFLFGHSLGGLVTAGSVTSLPDNIAGVILSSAALPAAMSSLGQSAVRLIASIIPSVQVPISRAPIEELCHDQEQIRLIMEDPMKHQPKISFSVASTALQVAGAVWKAVEERQEGREAVGNIWTMPTLAIHYKADSRAEYRQCERLVGLIASTDKEMYSVDGVYHEPFNAAEAEREQTFRHVLDWLTRRIPQQS